LTKFLAHLLQKLEEEEGKGRREQEKLRKEERQAPTREKTQTSRQVSAVSFFDLDQTDAHRVLCLCRAGQEQEMLGEEQTGQRKQDEERTKKGATNENENKQKENVCKRERDL
jgi:hypothetical protein